MHELHSFDAAWCKSTYKLVNMFSSPQFIFYTFMLILMKINIRTHNKNSAYIQKYVVFNVKHDFVLSFPVWFLTNSSF